MSLVSKDDGFDGLDGIISQKDLKQLGLNNVGYIRIARLRGEDAFILHAADGTALAVKHSADDAEAVAAEHDIGLALLH